MGGTKIKAKMRASVKPANGNGKPIRPEGGDAGLLSGKIITVVRQRKEKEKKNESKEKKG